MWGTLGTIQHFPLGVGDWLQPRGVIGLGTQLCSGLHPPLGVCVARGLRWEGAPAGSGCTVILLYVFINMDHLQQPPPQPRNVCVCARIWQVRILSYLSIKLSSTALWNLNPTIFCPFGDVLVIFFPSGNLICPYFQKSNTQM